MANVDLTKNYKRYYSSDLQPECVPIEHASFLSISGIGDPAGQTFSNHVRALYAVADGVKFLSKLRGKDFIVPKLEASWSYDEMLYSNTSIDEAPFKIPRNAWHYTLRIRMPGFVFKKEVSQALDVARLKKKVLPEQEIIFEEIPLHEVIQLLQPNLFKKETESLQNVVNVTIAKGRQKSVGRNEMYLSHFKNSA